MIDEQAEMGDFEQQAMILAHQTAVEGLMGRPLGPCESNLCRGFWDIGFTPEQTALALTPQDAPVGAETLESQGLPHLDIEGAF